MKIKIEDLLPLICDPVPRHITVITYSGTLTRDQVATLKQEWREAQSSGVLILPDDFNFKFKRLDIGHTE